jgi:hypothetical protein
MANVTRSECLQGTLTILGGTGVAASSALEVQGAVSSKPGIKLAEVPIGGDRKSVV